jgi:hypothetical protein
VQGYVQFFVLFAGPMGLLGLTALVVSRWVIQSWRKERAEPRLRVIPGGADDASRSPEQRP